MFCHTVFYKFYRACETIFLLHDGSCSLRLLDHCGAIEDNSDGMGKLLGSNRSPRNGGFITSKEGR